MRKILRVDMGKRECRFTDIPKEYERLGGRGLTSTLISLEVDPLCHPLGATNKLVIAPGILGGTLSPCSQRISVGAKSPLTGGVKEANSGGISGQKMGRMRLAAIVLEGKPKTDDLYVLVVTKDDARLEEAGDLKGKGNYHISEALREKYGSHVGIASIGPAGEKLLAAASVAFIDKDGVPCRHAARGGLGSVMGSKGIKAIVIDDAGTKKVVQAADQETFKKTVQEFIAVIKERPRVKNRLPIYGTAGLVAFSNEVNAFPTRNFTTGQFEEIEKIAGEHVGELIDERGGERGHACYPGCIIRCSNVYMDKEGKHLTSSLEYETLGMLGANCAIGDVDTIALLDRLCDDYGVDTIEIGGAMGVAMEAGVLEFGDGERAVEILHEVAQGTHLGRIIGSGAAITGRVFGMTRVPTIKGQSFPAWDPRSALATGVTFITSPQGADHTAGRLQGVLEFDRFEPGTIAPLSQGMQVNVCVQDTIGLCQFSDGTPESAVFLARLLSAYYGEAFTVEDFIKLGEKIFRTEVGFNRRAGISLKEDRLPEFMLKESLPPTNAMFTVDQEEIDSAFAHLREDNED
ncbi:MAG: aldehyde ferredoxin oxidoreductase [Deltaproteobacteria bacterium]|nr:aldehyde ferredoxin oxidoreductase [Deltaproteobacteria bacterium]